MPCRLFTFQSFSAVFRRNLSKIVFTFTASTMLPSTVLRSDQYQFNFENNPYKAKKIWPPDFSKLPPKYQFRLEKRYRRRAKLAWARPQWTKFTKLAQYGLSICTLTRSVSLWDSTDSPFQLWSDISFCTMTSVRIQRSNRSKM